MRPPYVPDWTWDSRRRRAAADTIAVRTEPIRRSAVPYEPRVCRAQARMLVRLVNLLSALLSPILGKLFSFLEPYATGDGTMSLLLRGFAIRRRHASRLQQVARAIHTGALRGKVVLVTGTGRGLGSGIASHLAAGGVQLILPQRKGGDVPVLRQRLARMGTDAMRACAKDPHAVPQLAPSDIDVRSPLCGLEMGSLASIDRFVDELASQGVLLDGLINNAGMVPITGGVTSEGFEPAFGINYLGTAHLTLELHRRGLLQPDATIVNVTSEEHRLASFASVLDAPLPSTQQAPSGAQLDAKGPHGERRLGAQLGALPVDASVFNAMERYAFSKLLLTTFSHELARRVPCTIKDVCPGPVASEIARDAPWPLGDLTLVGMWLTFPSPSDAALPIVERLLADKTADVHYHMSEVRAAGSHAQDAAVGEWLWKQTAELLRTRQPPG